MDIFYDRLPENKHPIYYQAARHVLLSEETAGGYTELLRLEQLVEKLENLPSGRWRLLPG